MSVLLLLVVFLRTKEKEIGHETPVVINTLFSRNNQVLSCSRLLDMKHIAIYIFLM